METTNSSDQKSSGFSAVIIMAWIDVIVTSTHKELWLDAHDDPTAGLYTFSQCIILSDLHGDGDQKLIIADLGNGVANMKLKIYKGTSIVNESTLIDIPTAVVAFHMDTLEPRVPAIGVASGAHIYIYKNMRPYFKFTLPSLDINPAEQDIWNQAKADKIDVITLREVLEGIRNDIGEANLTTRSQKFLMIDPEEMVSFANTHKLQPLKKQTMITCLSTLKKSMYDDDAISCLVLGTESQSIYILDPQAFTILSTASLSSPPVFLSVIGLFDVEYRITVTCRDGCVYSLKRGSKEAQLCIELAYHPISVVTLGKNIVVGCTDATLQCYSTKGKQMWRQKLPASITAMEILELRIVGMTVLAVAMDNCKVFFFSEKFKVGELNTLDVVIAMKFGRFGREDSSLILVTKDGSLSIKILKRTARFELQNWPAGVKAAPPAKLNVPKRTKLFVDQTMRERENSLVMHRVYQQDLYKLRLNTARCFVEALESSLNPVSTDPQEAIKVSARVQGLGPTFCLKVELQNTSEKKISSDLAITFMWDTKVYSVDKSLIRVPLLIPGIQYVFQTMIKCISDLAVTNTIKVLVFKMGQLSPLVTAIVSMPISEPITTADS